MLFLPAMAMLLFGYSFSGDITDVRVAFVDEDDTDLTASILESLQEDDAFEVTVLSCVDDPEKLSAMEEAARGFAKPTAAADIVAGLEGLAA